MSHFQTTTTTSQKSTLHNEIHAHVLSNSYVLRTWIAGVILHGGDLSSNVQARICKRHPADFVGWNSSKQ